jgi:c-di-GMP-binding flagellar brake protein YcgR
MSLQPQPSSAFSLRQITVSGEDRRAASRHAVDANAEVSLLKLGTVLQCKLLDLSLGGCCLRTPHQFTAGIKVLMELVLRVRGSVLRLNGVSQWTDRKHLIGVRFVDMNARRTELLQLLIEDVEYDNKRTAEKELPPEMQVLNAIAFHFEANEADIETQELPTEAIEIPPTQNALQPSAVLLLPLPAALPALWSEIKKPVAQTLPNITTAKETRERLAQLLTQRKQQRYDVDSKATVYLVNIGVRLSGRIQDLSPGGCRIRTDERFSVGIYVRAEVDFYLEGLPFRLPGVTQAIYDKHTIGVRFLDMSERKREQLHMLIEELKEIAECEREISELEAKEANDFRQAS